ncbi:MAG: hypothetical protein A2998_03015 [Candidatus Staskawiczbacteria bacterium RIFCSPLOWO2_01_FULL_37_25b]|uniref:Uncharacterized protein n=1 Tax=Candidatus Staskawiczbacteria bacterium RIFCSPLOWO2_01_FULL_37_25b TaxID=1802213 RepID=A0A1G2IE23_9BACT|nr:MAG: hypothetical protein A2998_03015 [Candidatus Staskawiczbacteria bacterium RIFCSPLOWO2_01_FULL_37_25b]
MRNLVCEATYWIVVGNITQEVLTGSSFVDKPHKASFQEKLYLNKIIRPYRKPTQVDKRKYAKVNGLNLVKELGKQVAVSSQYGLPDAQAFRAATNVLQPTVYQKHNSLLTRKRMYRG